MTKRQKTGVQPTELGDNQLDRAVGGAAPDSLGGSLDSLSGMTSQSQLGLQLLMERRAQQEAAASSALKAAAGAGASIVGNLK